MSTLLENLKKQLEDLEKDIRELKDRLPAHSIKPVMMSELMALEDERDAVLSKIQLLTPEQ
jgi:hypothetical protein